MLAVSLVAMAQGQVKGLVLDKATSEAMPFVSVTLTPQGATTHTVGLTTDIEGRFHMDKVPYGTYTLTLAYVGYKTVTRQLTLSQGKPSVSYAALHLAEDATMLNEVKVTGQRATMKLEVDRKSLMWQAW